MAPFLYTLLKGLFSITSHSFYTYMELAGLENVPEEDTPTLLCFNHGNSLGDPIVLITNTPRTIRFCAKNTLWDVPFIGQLVKASGAVPVYRKQENGEKSREFNVETFRAVYKAFENGNCVGFAPEGVSTFRSYSTKFKSGPGFIALEAVERALKQGKDDFKLHIVPSIMIFTHREKFRSDVLVRYRPPIIIDKSWLEPGRFKTRKDAAYEVIRQIEEEFHCNLIEAPNWKVVKRAITAVRIHRPLGDLLNLDAYMYLLRGWTKLLLIEDKEEIKLLIEKLENYQNILDTAKIKDERIRRCQLKNNCKKPTFLTGTYIILYRLIICLMVFTAALPGLLVWSPIWYLIKKKEKELLKKGAGWADSIAENKMKLAFFFLVILGLTCVSFAPLYLLPILYGYLWLMLRLYEEGVASGRSIFGIHRLMTISQEKLNTIIETREETRKCLLNTVKFFPLNAAGRIKKYCNDDVNIDETLRAFPKRKWPGNFSLLRRRKKDWNEILRLKDHCTMDYISEDVLDFFSKEN